MGNSALIMAATKGENESVKLLLNSGADANFVGHVSTVRTV